MVVRVCVRAASLWRVASECVSRLANPNRATEGSGNRGPIGVGGRLVQVVVSVETYLVTLMSSFVLKLIFNMTSNMSFNMCPVVFGSLRTVQSRKKEERGETAEFCVDGACAVGMMAIRSISLMLLLTSKVHHVGTLVVHASCTMHYLCMLCWRIRSCIVSRVRAVQSRKTEEGGETAVRSKKVEERGETREKMPK